MVVHIDPLTGQPLFIMDQIMMVNAFKKIYDTYGIHGIYYIVFYGWAASPYATITNPKERHEMVWEEVGNTKYYDPVTKTDQRSPKRAVPYPEPPQPPALDANKRPIPKTPIELKRDEASNAIFDACKKVTKIARVPVLESKIQYLAIIDRIWDGLKQPFDHRKSASDAKEAAALQKLLLGNRKDAEERLDHVLVQEREILTKADVMACLNDFWLTT